jgi:hypothetical protein
MLTIALAFLLLDDQSLPSRWSSRASAAAGSPRPWPRAVLAPVAGVVLFASTVAFVATLDRAFPFPRAVVSAYGRLAAFRSANTYGLFMVMTTERPEILVEGSDDGSRWRAYEFRWKPGDPRRRPAFVAPHQPRLDWQMWFAALGRIEQNPWLDQFLDRLLEGSPEVLGLLAGNPFPNRPPRYVRAMLDDYRFTTESERRRFGLWWKRQALGIYAPARERGAS